jgi:hypothetical protein
MTECEKELLAIRQWLSKPPPHFSACGCMGKLNESDPDCACKMQMYEQVEGSWYKIEEHRSPNGITHTATRV